MTSTDYTHPAVRAAMAAVLAAHPTAKAVHVVTTDQAQDWGFVLNGVWLTNGQRVTPTADLDNTVWDLLADVPWDGPMGEDERGGVALSVERYRFAHPRRTVRPQEPYPFLRAGQRALDPAEVDWHCRLYLATLTTEEIASLPGRLGPSYRDAVAGAEKALIIRAAEVAIARVSARVA